MFPNEDETDDGDFFYEDDEPEREWTDEDEAGLEEWQSN